jgi:hypothetical protein
VIVACVSLSAAGAVASDRVPVQSIDDTSLSTGNRIGAVDNVATAMDARIGRIIGLCPRAPALADHPGPDAPGLLHT